jgi:hypothetical protein
MKSVICASLIASAAAFAPAQVVSWLLLEFVGLILLFESDGGMSVGVG